LPVDGRRPLASDRAQFEALYETRRTAYLQAHYRLGADRGPAEALADELLEQLEA